MASTYSTLLKIELINTGEKLNTWGVSTNTNLGTAIEEAITGIATVDFPADANVTISLTDTSATQPARNLGLTLTSTGSLTATRSLIVPDGPKQYLVYNNTTGGQNITVKTSAGAGVTVPNGGRVHVMANGTDVVAATNFLVQPVLMGSQEVKAAIAAGDIDLATANYFTKTVTANITFTLSNVPATGIVANFILDLTNGGAYTVTWWSGVKWPDGVAPILTPAGRDVLAFFTHDGGTTWNCFLVGENLS